MSETPARNSTKRDRTVAASVVGMACIMLGMSFAAVPLYQMFCRATGYGGTTQVATGESSTRGTKTMTVRFDANVSAGLPWAFEPEQPKIRVTTGETVTVFYKVRNLSDRTTSGIAAYNVTPDQSGLYFNKISCFCFSEQTLGPRESAEWPVVFYLDPALEKDEVMKAVESITLSYSFSASKGSVAAAAAPPKL